MIILFLKRICPYIIFLTVFLSLFFVSDYGFRVNDKPYISNVEINKNNFTLGTERNSLNGDMQSNEENIDKWLMRYRLYSVDSDEMNTIMALSRIKPEKFDFDPHHYSYGGAFLYPLGIWFYFLKKIDVIKVGNLDWMLDNPDEVEKIYQFGRIFNILALILTGIIFYNTLLNFFPQAKSLYGVLLFYLSPAILMFGIVMKPHVYSLLWVVFTMFFLSKFFSSFKTLKLVDYFLISAGVGLAVGSVITNFIFAIYVWFFLLFQTLHKKLEIRYLFIIPITSILIFFLSNPYILLNYDAFQSEKMAQQGWFYFGYSFEDLWLFIRNSIIPGLGFSMSLMLFSLIFFKKTKHSRKINFFISFMILFSILFYASLSASVSDWHINSRYLLYIIPIAISLTLSSITLNYAKVLILISLIQIIPMYQAYIDENSLEHSTRLKSAEWINNNLPKNSYLCTSGKSIAPYDNPPFDFGNYQVNTNQCDFFVILEREVENPKNNFGMPILKRFDPRYNLSLIPLVYSHINPRITIYDARK